MKKDSIFMVIAVIALFGYGSAFAGDTQVSRINNIDEGFVYALGIAESGQKTTTKSDKSKLYIKAAINGLFELSRNVKVSVKSIMKDYISVNFTEDKESHVEMAMKTIGLFDLEGLKMRYISRLYATEEHHLGDGGSKESSSYAIATDLEYGKNRLKHYHGIAIENQPAKADFPPSNDEEDFELNGNRVTNYENLQRELFSYLEGKGVKLQVIRVEYDDQNNVDRVWLEVTMPLKNIPLKTLSKEMRKIFKERSNSSHEALKARLFEIKIKPKAIKENTSQLIKDYNPPEWVLKGAFFERGVKVLYGVGSSTFKDLSLQRSAANDFARQDLAMRLDLLASLFDSRHQSLSTVEDITVKTITSGLLSGAIIVDHWYHPARNELFSLARIDLESIKKNPNQASDRSEEFTKLIEEMELEIIKQEGTH